VDTFENGRAMVRRAFDLGITHFDLANNYGPPPGSAESNFGEILRLDLKPYRDELIISSARPAGICGRDRMATGVRASILLASLDQSLKRMGLEYVDIFYSHRPDPETPIEETMGALDQAVRSGKALYAGISSYDCEADCRGREDSARSFGTPCLIHQPKYSMFDRWVEDGLLDVLGNEGIGGIAFCPLAQGLLDRPLFARNSGRIRAHQAAWISSRKMTLTSTGWARSTRAEQIGQSERGQSLAQMALAWVLRDGA
jgi:L-glyceraldehyde 3-phosphate reductase